MTREEQAVQKAKDQYQSPIVKAFGGYIILANNIDDFLHKRNEVMRGETDGFITIDQILR